MHGYSRMECIPLGTMVSNKETPKTLINMGLWRFWLFLFLNTVAEFAELFSYGEVLAMTVD